MPVIAFCLLPVPVIKCIKITKLPVGFSQGTVYLQRLFNIFSCFWNCFIGRNISPKGTAPVELRQSYIGKCKVRIFPECLLKILGSFLQSILCHFLIKISALQIEVISFKIICRDFINQLLFLRCDNSF